MRTEPKILIIILNWNQYKLTQETLYSLQNIEYQNYQILLIDNGSTDDSFHRLKAEFPGLYTIANEENLGVAGGRNAGIAFARKMDYDYLLFLDNDVLVAPDFLSELVSAMDFYPNVGGTQSLVLQYGKPDSVCSAGGQFFPLICHNRSRKGVKISALLRDGCPQEIDWMGGVVQLIKREVFSHVKGYDEDYNPYGPEDAQMGLAMRRAGYRLLLVPSSRIWHRAKREKNWREFQTRNNAQSMVVFLRKNSNWVNFPFALAWHLLNYVMRSSLRYLFTARYDLLNAFMEGLRLGWTKHISQSSENRQYP
jgi:GT2 family glycosyltransferase